MRLRFLLVIRIITELISIEDDKIVITLPDNGKSFDKNYDEVFRLVNDNIQRSGLENVIMI